MTSRPSLSRSAIAALLATAALLLPATADAKPGGGNDRPKRHRVDLIGATKMVGGSPIPGPAKDQGTISGKPFGDGKIKLTVQLDLATSSATGTFRIRNDKGTALGTVDLTFVLSIPTNEITFDGTADFTGGKGRYKGIEGTELKAHDHNTLDGQNGTLSLKGFATW